MTVRTEETDLILDCKKDVNVLFDKNRKQYSIKIPKEISEIYNLKKGDKFRFIVEIRENEMVRGKFEVVKQR